MSVNKILALIGAIFFSIFGGIYGFLTLIGGIAFMAMANGYNSPFAGLAAIMLSLILLAVLAATWVAFAHLDKKNDQPWKVYFLVIGILFCITVVCAIWGVLFILTFALKTAKPAAEEPQSVATETSWTEVNQSTVVSSESKAAPIDNTPIISEASSEQSNADFGWTEAVVHSEQKE